MEEINVEFMSFSEAMQNLLEGKKVARDIWKESIYDPIYLYLDIVRKEVVFAYFDEDEEVYFEYCIDVEFSYDEILAVDWKVVE